jgi:hypothetical protein
MKLTHEADRDPEQQHFQRIEDGLVSGFTLEKRFLRKDGKISVWTRALEDSAEVYR